MLCKVEYHLVVGRIVRRYTVLAAAFWRIHVVVQRCCNFNHVFSRELGRQAVSRLVIKRFGRHGQGILCTGLEPISALIELNPSFYAVSI